MSDRSRRLLGVAGFLAGAALTAIPAAAQETPDPYRVLTGPAYSDAPNSLYRHLQGEVLRHVEARERSVAGLTTEADWRARRASVRQTLLDVLGPFPEPGPLNPRVMGTLRRDGYRVEKVVFDSRPGLPVTGALFVPESRRGRVPAILYLSGHTPLSFRSAAYQRVILNLVRKGFVVLAIDPVGQGERLEYTDPTTGKPVLSTPASTIEHAYTGGKLMLAGGSLAGVMTWDGVRAIDYLVTRPEVDPGRIGVTGRSGGGTQSAYLAAVDERVRAAAIENYVTSVRRLWETRGPQDAEQHFLAGIARGLDHADLLVARAPKPTLLVATTRDIFNIQGTRETYAEAKRAFAALGAPDHLRMVEDDAPHESTPRNREALYAFFQESLELPGSPADEAVTLIPGAELQVTRTGQVVTALDAVTTFDLTGRAAELRSSRGRTRDPVAAARRLSGYRDPGETGEAVFMGRHRRPGYAVEAYILPGEGGYPVPFLLLLPDGPPRPVVLYLDPAGKGKAVVTGGHMEWLVRQGYAVLAPDLLGVGEMGPGAFRGDSYDFGDRGQAPFGLWFGAASAGRSIVGIQAADVVRLVRWAGGRPELGGEGVRAIARGELGPVLLHAAAFEPAISAVALVESLRSYDDLVNTRDYQPRFVPAGVAGMLAEYDLPELAASLAPRPVLLLNPVDAAGAPLREPGAASEAEARAALRSWISRR